MNYAPTIFVNFMAHYEIQGPDLVYIDMLMLYEPKHLHICNTIICNP